MVTVLGTQKIIGVFDTIENSGATASVVTTSALSDSSNGSAAEDTSPFGSLSLASLSSGIALDKLKPLEVLDIDVISKAHADANVPAGARVPYRAATPTNAEIAEPDTEPKPSAAPIAIQANVLAMAMSLADYRDVASASAGEDPGGTSYEDWSFDTSLDPSTDTELGDEIASQEAYVPSWQSYTIQRGDTFALTAERTLGLEYATVMQILDTVPDKKVLTRWRVGKSFDYKLDANGGLLALRVMKNPRDGYLLERDADAGDFDYSPIVNATEASQRMFTGTVNGSFAASAQSTGLSSKEVSELTQILSKKLDFRRNARVGDKFQVLVESDMIDGESLDSKILAAEYEGDRMDLTVIRNSADDHFYTPDGNSLDPAFDRYPFEGHYRVSSSFNLRRHHPVTGRISPHKGTDFAMRTGTPIEAPAAGRVERVVNHPIAGKYVLILHDNGYETRYLHLSKALVKPGQRVKMGQTIAMSGSTGRVTGPHLHYEVLVNNRQVDAMRVPLPESQSLRGDALAAFKRESENLLAKLDQTSNDGRAIASVSSKRKRNVDDSI